MDWSEYSATYLSSGKDVLEGLSFSFDGFAGVYPSEFVKENIRLINEFGLLENNCFAICYPSSPKFLAALVVSDIFSGFLSGDVKPEPFDISKFHVGDKIIIENAVTEIQGIDDKLTGGREGVTYVKILDSWLPVNENLPPFVKADKASKPSSSKMAKEAFKNYRQKWLNEKPINAYKRSLLDLKSLSIGTIALISDGQKLRELIGTAKVSTERGQVGLCDCISTAYINETGELKGEKTASQRPQLVIAPSIASLCEYLSRTEGTVEKIVVDFQNVDADSFDLNSIAMIDGCDHLRIHFFVPENIEIDSSYFSDRSIKIFRWLPNMLESTLKSDGPLDKNISNFSNLSVQPKVVNDRSLDAAFAFFNENNAITDQFDSQLAAAFFAVKSAFFRVTRRMANGDDYLEEMTEKIQSSINLVIQEDYLKKSCFSSLIGKLNECYQDICLSLLPSIQSKYELMLNDVLTSDDSEQDFALVVTDEQKTEDFINKINDDFSSLKGRNCTVDLMSVSELLSCTKNYDKIYVCGWLKKAIMRQIVFSNLAPKCVPLLLPHETGYCKCALRKWSEEIQNSGIEDFGNNILPVVCNLDFNFEDLGVVEERDLDVEMAKDAKRKFGAFNSDGCEAEREGYPIQFSDFSVGVFSDGYAFQRVVSNNDCLSIVAVPTAEIRPGMVVLFKDAETDVIKAMTDSMLEEKEKIDLTDKAESWKISIRFSGLEYDDFSKGLKALGVKRTENTIRNWFDPDCQTICPSDLNDLKAIAMLTMDDMLLDSAYEVMEAAQTVRTFRREAGRRLIKELSKNETVLSKIKSACSSFSFLLTDQTTTPIDLKGLGTVDISILQIAEKEERISVKGDLINKRRM